MHFGLNYQKKHLIQKADLLAGEPTENKFSTSQLLLGMFIHPVMLSKSQ